MHVLSRWSWRRHKVQFLHTVPPEDGVHAPPPGHRTRARAAHDQSNNDVRTPGALPSSLVPINTARYRVASTVTRKKIVVMMLSHGALLSPETVLSPPSCHLAVSRVATTRPPTHPPRAGGGGGSTPPHRPPPSLASPAPRAPCALGTVPPTPFRLAPPPYIYLFSITLHDPKPDSLRYSLAFNHNSYPYPHILFSLCSVYSRTDYRTRSRTVRAL